MYFGNIHWKHCRLKTLFAFGNKNYILETYELDWKEVCLKLKTYNETPLAGSHVKYTIMAFDIRSFREKFTIIRLKL